ENGGLAWGGGLDTFDTFGFGLAVTISDSTISHNSAIGGARGGGGDRGGGWGGGLANLLRAGVHGSGSNRAPHPSLRGACAAVGGWAATAGTAREAGSGRTSSRPSPSRAPRSATTSPSAVPPAAGAATVRVKVAACTSSRAASPAPTC